MYTVQSKYFQRDIRYKQRQNIELYNIIKKYVINQNPCNLSLVSVDSSKPSSKSEAGCSCERVGRAVICRRKDAEVDSYKCANYELEYFVELFGRTGRGARADKGI